VLSGFEGPEKELFELTVETAADAIAMVLRRGVQMAMNIFNAKHLELEGETEEPKK